MRFAHTARFSGYRLRCACRYALSRAYLLALRAARIWHVVKPSTAAFVYALLIVIPLRDKQILDYAWYETCVCNYKKTRMPAGHSVFGRAYVKAIARPPKISKPRYAAAPHAICPHIRLHTMAYLSRERIKRD